MPAKASEYDQLWWNATKGKVYDTLFSHVVRVTNRQALVYDRFVKLEVSYDPNNLSAGNPYQTPIATDITENVIASNVDTVASAIAATEIAVAVNSNGADWGQRRADKHLEWYAQAAVDCYDVNPIAVRGAKNGAKKGSGFVFVTKDEWNRPQVEHVMPDDVVVDELECRYGEPPRWLARRKSNVAKEKLKAEFPQFAKDIDAAGAARGRDYLRRGGYNMTSTPECVEVEAWFLPIGKKGAKGYKPGRHVRAIDGCDLVDEPYHKAHLPVAKYDWTPRDGAYFGISLAERIWGHQRVVNKRHWQADKIIDLHAMPMRYFRPADAKLAVQTHDMLGNYAVVRSDYPHLETPQTPVSPQIFEHMDMMSQKAFQETGTSRMAAQAMKPAGLDSGAALRAYHDHTTQRFALQEIAFERFVLHIVWLLIDLCKDLGDAAPKLLENTKFGDRKINWAKVDMEALKYKLAAKSTLDNTPAGREQTVLEWAQDTARRMLEHPDLEREMSLYTAAMEHVDWMLEEIADGEFIVPEPFANIEMIVWRSQMQYLNWVTYKAPEPILEEVRRVMTTAAYQVAQKNGLVQNGNMAALPGGAAAQAAPPPAAGGAMPPLPGGPPANAPAVAALSPQAMQVLAR